MSEEQSSIGFVCFDLGGVVVRICRTWAEACARAGIDVREPARFASVELVQARHELVDAYMSGRLGCDAFFAGISKASGGLYEPGEIERIHFAWTIEDEPGVEDLIERLNAGGAVVTACLSNTNHAHWQKLTVGGEASPAIARLQRHLVSHELGAVKPDQTIYVAAEEALGASPEQVVFFDDMEENVIAARARGWHAHVIDYARQTVPQMEAVLAELGVLPGARSRA